MKAFEVWIGRNRLAYLCPTEEDHLIKVHLSWFPQAQIGDCIVCDVCNAEIPYPYIWVLVLVNGDEATAWGTYCEECKREYHPERDAYIIPAKLFEITTCRYCAKVLNGDGRGPDNCDEVGGELWGDE